MPGSRVTIDLEHPDLLRMLTRPAVEQIEKAAADLDVWVTVTAHGIEVYDPTLPAEHQRKFYEVEGWGGDDFTIEKAYRAFSGLGRAAGLLL